MNELEKESSLRSPGFHAVICRMLGIAALTPTYAFRDQMKTDRLFNDLSPAAEPPLADLIPVL
jgi:hypothetical protein